MSDIEPEIESDDSDNEGILSAFTTTVDPTEGIVEIVDEEEDLVESSSRRWMNRMTSILLMQSYMRYLKSMRSCIGCPLRSLVKWSRNERSCPQKLMKPIKPLEH